LSEGDDDIIVISDEENNVNSIETTDNISRVTLNQCLASETDGTKQLKICV
jgi:hypothetical protein